MPHEPGTKILRGYVVAIATVAVATVLRLSLTPYLGTRQPFVAFFIALIVTTWYTTLGPSIVALSHGALIAATLFLPPPQASLAEGLANILGIALYLGVGSTLIVFSQTSRTARKRLEA